MYYTNVFFGHPFFAPSALIRRNDENATILPQPVNQTEGLSTLNDDFIELDVRSESAHTISGDEADSDIDPTASSPSNSPSATAV